jgi:hypothetical protein
MAFRSNAFNRPTGKDILVSPVVGDGVVLKDLHLFLYRDQGRLELYVHRFSRSHTPLYSAQLGYVL